MKATCTTKEAIALLEISPREFYRRKAEDDSKITPSKVQGKYFRKSILLEFKRIHGVSREELVS